MKTHYGWARVALLTVACIWLASCERAFLAEPQASDHTATLALDLVTAGGGGATSAFDKADAVWIRLRSNGVVRLDTGFSVRANGADLALRIPVQLRRTSENLETTVEVRWNSSPLFRGSAAFDLRVGPRPTRQPMTLNPVISSIVLPDTLPTLTAYGDSAVVQGAAVFATRDTVATNLDISWTSLDPDVVEIQGGMPVARSDGTARLIGQLDALADTTSVRVFAVVTSVVVSPDSTAPALPIGATRQYTARLYDRRGNQLSGRTLLWHSSNTEVLRIDLTGMATGMGLGTALVSASSGPAAATLNVQVRALPPMVATDSATNVTAAGATLHTRIMPNRVTAEHWIEYSTDSLFQSSENSVAQLLPAGANSVPMTVPIGGLAAQTRYYARAMGRNAGGTTTGNVVSFVTAQPRSGELNVTTRPARNVTFSTATLEGSVRRGSVPATLWLEWSDSPTFAQFTAAQAVAVPAGGGDHIITVNLSDLVTGVTYYYRAAARIPGGPVYYGGVQSFRPGGVCDGAGGGWAASSVPCSQVTGPRVTIPERSTIPVPRQE